MTYSSWQQVLAWGSGIVAGAVAAGLLAVALVGARGREICFVGLQTPESELACRPVTTGDVVIFSMATWGIVAALVWGLIAYGLLRRERLKGV